VELSYLAIGVLVSAPAPGVAARMPPARAFVLGRGLLAVPAGFALVWAAEVMLWHALDPAPEGVWAEEAARSSRDCRCRPSCRSRSCCGR
jgi:hypothetical protein